MQGKFKTTHGPSLCQDCPAGRVGNALALTTALCKNACPPGYWCVRSLQLVRRSRMHTHPFALVLAAGAATPR
jgi:hypothetical protein